MIGGWHASLIHPRVSGRAHSLYPDRPRPDGFARNSATARPKASGLPFNSRLTDIAANAGLSARVVFGDEARTTYILEATGYGIAFLDYDNDGWISSSFQAADGREPRPEPPTGSLTTIGTARFPM
jgi:hypothetical protein